MDRPGPAALAGFKVPRQSCTYTFGRVIGKGNHTVVYVATRTAATSAEEEDDVAIKVIPKSSLALKAIANVKREIDIGLEIDHPNVLSILDVFETAEMLFLVSIYVEGGDLYERIVQDGAFSEGDAVHIVRQICEAVAYLNSRDICHRDIKPENLLCTRDEAGHFKVVLSDFGLSRRYKHEASCLMMTRCGTALYLAPEVIKGMPYTITRDTWSIGVVTYVILTGCMPYSDFARITNGAYPMGELEPVSDLARSFIAALLCTDPQRRLTATECLKHEWLSPRHESRASTIDLRSSVLRLSQVVANSTPTSGSPSSSAGSHTPLDRDS